MSEGLEDRYQVIRLDGRDAVGEKHRGCQYFVLDITHDVHARAAAVEYARLIGNDVLRCDLMKAGYRAATGWSAPDPMSDRSAPPAQ